MTRRIEPKKKMTRWFIQLMLLVSIGVRLEHHLSLREESGRSPESIQFWAGVNLLSITPKDA